MKSDIQRLIQAEHDAKKKEAALVSIPQETNTSRDTAQDLSPQDESSTARELPVFPAMNAMVHVGTGSRGIDSVPNPDSVPRDLSRPGLTPEDTVLEYLKQCADAAARLTFDIEKAIGKWDGSREYQPGCLLPAFQSTTTAMDRLSNYEDKCASVTHPPPQKAPLTSDLRWGHHRSILIREHDTERGWNEQPPKPYTTVKRYQVPESNTRYEPIIIREERRTSDRQLPKPIIIRDDVREYRFERMERRESKEEKQPVGEEEPPPPAHQALPQQDEDYFYERRAIERPRSRDHRSEIRPKDTASNYSSDDSYEYIRRERTDSDGVQDPHHKRFLVEGTLAGVATADILRHHGKSEAEGSRGRLESAVGEALVGGVDPEVLSRSRRSGSRPRAGSRSRSRSNSGDSRRNQRRRYPSRSRSRSRSKLIPRKLRTGLASVAAIAALGARATNKMKGDGNDHQRYDLDHRNRRVAQAGLATAASVGISERPLLKARERSKSRIRQPVPVASAGLGGVALTGLWEKNKADKEPKRILVTEEPEGQGRRRRRSDESVTTAERSPTRDSRVYDPTAYTESMQAPWFPPPPDSLPLTSATYIPDGEGFGPGVKIPPLEAHDETGSETKQVFEDETYISSTRYGYPDAQSKTVIGKGSENEQTTTTSRGALVHKDGEEGIVRRPGTPSLSPLRNLEKDEIIIRRRERSASPVPEPPREPTPERLPPPPEPLYRASIIPKVITHHKHIYHDIERTRSPTPPQLQQEDPPRPVGVPRRASFDNVSNRWAGLSFDAETSDDSDEGEIECTSVPLFQASRPHSPSLGTQPNTADAVFTASKRGQVFSLRGLEESMISIQLDDGPAFVSSSASDEDGTLPLIESSKNQVAVAGEASTEDIMTVDELLGQWTTLKIGYVDCQ